MYFRSKNVLFILTFGTFRFADYNYDDNGNKIEENTFGGYQTQKTTYKYDDKRREVESLITLSFQGINGSAELRITKEYDQKGNIIEEKNYNNHNKLSSKGI